MRRQDRGLQICIHNPKLGHICWIDPLRREPSLERTCDTALGRAAIARAVPEAQTPITEPDGQITFLFAVPLAFDKASCHGTLF
jgi:hypothetical protein